MNRYQKLILAAVLSTAFTSVEAHECFDTYGSYQHGAANSVGMKQIFNGDGTTCANFVFYLNANNQTERVEIFDGAGKLRYIERYHYEDEGYPKPTITRTARYSPDGTLLYWSDIHSQQVHLADGRLVTWCEMGEFTPFWLTHVAEGMILEDCAENTPNIPPEGDG